MPIAVSGVSFQLLATDAPTGLVGTIAVQILDGATVLVARDDAGIVEAPAGSGDYVATRTVTQPGGPYRVVWDDGTEFWEADEPELRVLVASEIAYRPAVEEVADRAYARALDENGNRGTFTTDPTPAQVETLIDDAVAIVVAAIGATVPSALLAAAKYAVICRVAMAIERGFIPENTDSGDSAYQAWQDEYDAAIAALTIGMSADQPNRARFVSIPIVPANRPTRIDPVTLDLL